jgi:head-tail adaptor
MSADRFKTSKSKYYEPRESSFVDLRYRIEIDFPLLADDGLGGQSETWIDKRGVMAKVENIRINSTLTDSQVLAGDEIRCIIRNGGKGIVSGCRVKWQGRFYIVNGVMQIGQKYIEFYGRRREA